MEKGSDKEEKTHGKDESALKSLQNRLYRPYPSLWVSEALSVKRVPFLWLIFRGADPLPHHPSTA